MGWKGLVESRKLNFCARKQGSSSTAAGDEFDSLCEAGEPGKSFHHAQTELEPLSGKSSRYGAEVGIRLDEARLPKAHSLTGGHPVPAL